VLLNITPDHLDRYDSFEAYAASKMRLFQMQSFGHASIDASADPAILERFLNLTAAGHHVSVPKGMHAQLERHDGWPALQGTHNQQNAWAAYQVCFQIFSDLGLSDVSDEISEALCTYPGLPHRMERIRERDGVLFVNDSKATNPTATAPGLAAFDRIRWICGGQAKTDNLDECVPHFGHVASAYTIGEAADLFETLLSPHMPVKNCGKLDVAVREAAADAAPGDTVLLSPACASFDQFRDFEHRGDQFRALVGEL
jgi:UDP-N-acetylmuramoylalanine--D-glutamate ligase